MWSIRLVLLRVLIILGLFVFLGALLFWRSLNATPVVLSMPPVAAHIAEKLQPGDLIFRSGTAYESYLIKQLSGSDFSHIGVVVSTTPNVQIIHATTDDDPKRLNQVLRSSLAEFVTPELASQWVVYRMTSLDDAAREQLLHSLEQVVGLPFRIQATDTEVARYCTTIIRDGLPLTLQQQLKPQATSYPGFKGELLFPNAFLALEPLELIYHSE
jgi:hypothetical protein